MNEEQQLFLENLFLAGQVQFLSQQSMALSQQLARSPKNIQIMTTLTRIENDLELLRPMAEDTNGKIFSLLEKRLPEGKTFKFFYTYEQLMKKRGKLNDA